MRELPKEFDRRVGELLPEIDKIEGFLTHKEMRFLALLAAVPTAEGEILEIGSFKGRSAVLLTKAAAFSSPSTIFAVDPMTAPSVTDPDLRGESDSFTDFSRNIESAGVADRVKLLRTFSTAAAVEWDRPLRLLWIDGDHTYLGTRADLEGFQPHLADKSIVAMHDVLHEFDGGVRVAMEHILLSPNFGACGFVGSIAWGQYLRDEKEALKYRKRKLSLYKKLSRLIPFVALREKPLTGWEKKRYKIARALVPHAAIDPRDWLAMLA
jgi:predicted O-methyltransferase YrrM